MSFENSEKTGHFCNALQAEGIVGPPGSCAFLNMKDWGLHWYFNNLNLVHKRSVSREGWPWTHPANQFAAHYEYRAGSLPVADDLAQRSALLIIASCLGQKDVEDIVTAIQKVVREIL